MTLNQLGEMPALIIKTVYWACGISFVLYSWFVLKAKKSIGDIFALAFGPIAWTTLIAFKVYTKIAKPKFHDYDHDIKYRITLDVIFICTMIPWVILGFWFTTLK
jgi:hypothetical protein